MNKLAAKKIDNTILTLIEFNKFNLILDDGTLVGEKKTKKNLQTIVRMKTKLFFFFFTNIMYRVSRLYIAHKKALALSSIVAYIQSRANSIPRVRRIARG